MTPDRPNAPWAYTTYNGFSGGGRAEPLPPPKPARPRGLILGGVAAAAVAGVVFAVFARPEIGARHDAAPQRVAAATAAEAAIPVEVAKVPPPAPPAPVTDRLEVLPPDMAAAARETRVVAPVPPRRLALLTAPSPVEPAPPRIEPPARVVETPPPAARPSFSCGAARSPAEQMVCGDAQLARLDQRLNRAFQRAVASGVPYRELRDEQDDWLRVREDAARFSPDAVANIYRQRIAELNQAAGE